MSSTVPSSEKAGTFRRKTLVPAGVVFVRMNEMADPNAQGLMNDLKYFNNLFPQHLLVEYKEASDIPDTAFAKEPLLEETVALRLISLSQDLAYSAQSADVAILNESAWRNKCHTPALSVLGSDFPGTITVVSDLAWNALTVGRGVILSKTTPDYSIGYPSADDSSPLDIFKLDDCVSRGLNAYVNETNTVAFPLAVIESKSSMGSQFEAENQCAENAIKMLQKLAMLEEPASNLPVVLFTLVGSHFAIYLATSGTRRSERGVQSTKSPGG